MPVSNKSAACELSHALYCETLKSAWGHSEQNALNTDIQLVLLHDNARPHTAARTQVLMGHFNWELFDHSPYSPDLAPRDCHLFTYLKNWLRSQRFTDNEFMEGVKTWLSSQTVDFFDTGTQKLIPRYDKCLSSGSDYIEN
jgi:histone-lysine N-methyltransferase SETMAR